MRATSAIFQSRGRPHTHILDARILNGIFYITGGLLSGDYFLWYALENRYHYSHPGGATVMGRNLNAALQIPGCDKQ